MPAAIHSEGCFAKKIKLWMCISKMPSVPKAGFFWTPRCIACHKGVTMRPCHSKELTETFVQKGAFQDHREVSKGGLKLPNYSLSDESKAGPGHLRAWSEALLQEGENKEQLSLFMHY